MGFCWNEQKLCRMGMRVGEPSSEFHLLRRVPWAVQCIHRGKNSQIERGLKSSQAPEENRMCVQQCLCGRGRVPPWGM